MVGSTLTRESTVCTRLRENYYPILNTCSKCICVTILSSLRFSLLHFAKNGAHYHFPTYRYVYLTRDITNSIPFVSAALLVSFVNLIAFIVCLVIKVRFSKLHKAYQFTTKYNFSFAVRLFFLLQGVYSYSHTQNYRFLIETFSQQYQH